MHVSKPNQPNSKKDVTPKKSRVKKDEIKAGDHKMAAMMVMPITDWLAPLSSHLFALIFSGGHTVFTA